MSDRRQINVRIDDATDDKLAAIRRHLAQEDVRSATLTDAVIAAIDRLYSDIAQRPRKRAS